MWTVCGAVCCGTKYESNKRCLRGVVVRRGAQAGLKSEAKAKCKTAQARSQCGDNSLRYLSAVKESDDFQNEILLIYSSHLVSTAALQPPPQRYCTLLSHVPCLLAAPSPPSPFSVLPPFLTL